ncbi:MFS-type transporter SLC18B1 isoform X2 [Leptinotarsa decemlineata]|uniref:MFS-type transporter SLC18B1 isoform X2 n=1 Tax=Leptinotarsa decemlineata TaxID=7539 RepID=UPI003D303F8E
MSFVFKHYCGVSKGRETIEARKTMEKATLLPSTSDVILPPENSGSSTSKSNFAVSSHTRYTGQSVYGTHNRSKSLSNISQDSMPRGEIRRIRERLLRANSHLVPSTVKSFTRRQKLTLVSIALVDFMSFCSMSIMAPFFPKEASEKGLSDTLSGVVFSFYALVMFISSPFFGKILPKFGAKFLFLFGIVVAGVCNILFGFLEYIQNSMLFTILCLIIRGCEALGASAFSTASYVFVVNTFPDSIGSVIGILETFVGLGMSAGPVLGGMLYSLGGFSMPFNVLGVAMLTVVPLNIFLLHEVEECDNMENKNTSIFRLLKVPAVVVTGTVVVIVSSTWSFLDPTLEPHLRRFDLSPEHMGLVFLLFSALYGISSPAWGWLADKVNNHWSMMIMGLVMCTIGLLLLGPCPILPFYNEGVWLDLIALSILGISVALALIPTFQGILTSALNAGCRDALATYSIVAGVWSCMYSLGEVIGPALGGFLLQYYGFPIASTVMALMTLSSAIIAFIFFSLQKSYCKDCESISDSGISGSWRSTTSLEDSNENAPLLLPAVDSSYKTFADNQYQYYDQYRKLKEEVIQPGNDSTDIRTTVSITGKGSCEI